MLPTFVFARKTKAIHSFLTASLKYEKVYNAKVSERNIFYFIRYGLIPIMVDAIEM